jgi:hypothetical protein
MLPMMTPYADALTVLQDQQAEQARKTRYMRALEAYNGQFPEPLQQGAMRVPSVKVNLAKLVADVGAAFLFGSLPGVNVDGDDTERGPLETWLDEVFEANNAPLTLLKLATNGAIMGDAYVKILPRSPMTGGLPRLVVLNPQTVTMFSEPDDVDDCFAYRIEYRDVDRRTGKPMNVRQEHVRQDNGAWKIQDYQEVAGKWVTDGPPQPWPYPFAAVLHCQNLPQPNECYGRADLDELLLDTNETINWAWTNLMKIMAIYAHPFTYSTGAVGGIDRSPDKMPNLPVGGAITMLQAQGVDASSIEVYLRLKEALHAVSETPEIATGKLDTVGQLSGVALKILYGPIVGKTERKRLTYGPMLADLARRLLAIGGQAEYGSVTPRLTWPELVPSDPLAERQALQIDHELGVSSQTIVQKLGYDAEVEQERKQGEDDAAMARQQEMAPAQPFGGQQE